MAQQRRTGSHDRQPIEASLQAAASYRLGEPIDVTFTVRNTSSQTYQVLTWGTPLEEAPRHGLPDGRTRRLGRPVDHGRIVNGGVRFGIELRADRAVAKVDRKVDISRSYPIDQPGDYTATIKADLHDAFAVAGNSKQAPRRRGQLERHPLPPVSVTFKVVPDGEARKTDGEAARETEKLAKGGGGLAKAKEPGFNGGTTQDQADTRVAHANAQYFAPSPPSS